MAENGRVDTGIPGLNGVLGGGLPGKNLYLIQGAPGTGKTTMGLQFLLSGRNAGEKVMYVTLSQTKGELEQIAASHGWNLEGVIVEDLRVEQDTDSTNEQTVLHTADLELSQTRAAILDALQQHKPNRLVYDSLLEVRYLSPNVRAYRRELLGFKAFVHRHEITTVLIDTVPLEGGDAELEGLAHGIVRLERAVPEYGVARRRLEVRKLRGTPIADGYHDLTIREGVGIEVYPRVVPHLAPEAVHRDSVKCGVDQLDAIVGGGLESGTTCMVVGQAGTGKSTLTTLYALAALERGEHAAMFLFEERLETFFRRAEGLGMDLRGYHEKGLLHLHDFNPAETAPGEFSALVQREVDEHDVRVLVVDSLTGYLAALPESRQAVVQIHSLLMYLSRRGVLTMMVVAQQGLLGRMQDSPLDVSFLGDSVLLLRMYEWPGTLRRTITVVKKRHGAHDMDVQELVIGPERLRVLPFNPPPPGEAGPLSSSPAIT